MVIALSLVKGWVKCPAAAVCALQEHTDPGAARAIWHFQTAAL